MGESDTELQWELQTRGTLDQISDFVSGQKRLRDQLGQLPKQYALTDVSPFSPSTAIYFMDGESSATAVVRGTGDEITFDFRDANTSISASAPVQYGDLDQKQGLHLAAPPPLRPIGFMPESLPEVYRRETTMHLLQVISMNMKDRTGGDASLLIGLPYAEKYPEIFFREGLCDHGAEDASSFGAVSSLANAGAVGYPARSAFAVLHILETPFGNFFNKKPTVMELQPDAADKLALKLPPIPFNYTLVNGPIPLYSVTEPDGEPIADIVVARHHAARIAMQANAESWPWHQPDLDEISRRRG